MFLSDCNIRYSADQWMREQNALDFCWSLVEVACVQTITKLWLVLWLDGVNQSLISSARRLGWGCLRTHLVWRGLRIIFVCILLLKQTSWYARHFEYSYKQCSCTTESKRKSNKKEIFTNNQQKKYNSMKHLSKWTTSLIHEDTYWD